MTAGPGEAEAGTGNGAERKKFFPKKFGGVEKKNVPNSVKRKRINFRLRKVIVPKSPIMVLNEMVGAVNYNFVDTHPPMPMQPGQPPMQLFTATCTVEGENFHGTGPSKQIAKNICAEHCIQYIVTKRCTENKNKAAEAVKAAATTTEGADKNGAAAAAATEGGADGEPGNPEGLKPHEMTDETPWAQLASLALFKLFNDWQAQGFAIPAELFKPPDYFNNQGTAPPMKGPQGAAPSGDVAMTAAGQPRNTPCKKVPDNPTSRHPVQLLNELRGTINYQLVEQRGDPPNCIFIMGAEVEGTPYHGEGKNKKDAKKAVALEILKQVHQITYPSNAPKE